ncbi:hypothetical protein ABH987_002800 [Bradyrhizobium ottawaense]
MQPLARLTTPSLAPAISSASMLIAPKSLTIAAIRRPSACANRWFTTVVLPAPRKPVTRRMGTGMGQPPTTGRRTGLPGRAARSSTPSLISTWPLTTRCRTPSEGRFIAVKVARSESFS